MRLGVAVGGDLDRAVQADRAGLWAVALPHAGGAEIIDAATLAATTEHVAIVVGVDVDAEHPVSVAEEIAVVDQLSRGRVVVWLDSPDTARADTLKHALAGRAVNGMLIAPPPRQTRVPVLPDDTLTVAWETLRGDPGTDAAVVDRHLAAGTTHLLVDWPGDMRVLARHLASRAAMVDFPPIMAGAADELAPFD